MPHSASLLPPAKQYSRWVCFVSKACVLTWAWSATQNDYALPGQQAVMGDMCPGINREIDRRVDSDTQQITTGLFTPLDDQEHPTL